MFRNPEEDLMPFLPNRLFLIPALAAITLLPGYSRAADAPHLILPANPAPAGPIKDLPVLHEGLQLTYSMISTNLPGDVDQVMKAVPGTLADPNSGWTLYTQKTHATSVGGPIEINIARIAGDQIVISAEVLATGNPSEPADAPPNEVARIPDIEKPGDGTLMSGHWLEPSQIEQFAKLPPAGCTVTRGPWKVGDHTFDAVIFSTHQESLELVDAYDPTTGLLLHRGMVSQGPPPAMVVPGQIPHGNVLLQFQDLAAVRDLPIPWANEPMPDWVKQLKVLHYQGTQQTGTGPMIQEGWDFAIQEAGDGWANTDVTRRIGNFPPGAATKMYYGRAQFAGIWAGPVALSKLQKGQTLDEDPITKMKFAVSYIDNKSITISESNLTGEIDWNYDKTTGMLLGQRTVGHVYVPVQRTDVEEHHLVGKE
jgi:hypothetical protein